MAFNFSKLSVLVVEDTLPMRKLLTSVLETLGVGTIYVANDGEDGFHTFCKNNPDIVLTDWHMLPVSGLELVDRIRKDQRSPNKMVPIIMMSGYSAIGRVGRARDYGATEFLVKPFSAKDVARRIAYVINTPRDFVDSEEFFGPDRRRRKIDNYKGPMRRTVDRQ